MPPKRIESLNISDDKTYSREEVIKLILKCLKATGVEIKTTMHFDKGFVEFDGKDLKDWIERNL